MNDLTRYSPSADRTHRHAPLVCAGCLATTVAPCQQGWAFTRDARGTRALCKRCAGPDVAAARGSAVVATMPERCERCNSAGLHVWGMLVSCIVCGWSVHVIIKPVTTTPRVMVGIK